MFRPASGRQYSLEEFAQGAPTAIPRRFSIQSLPRWYAPGDVESGYMTVTARTYATAIEALKDIRDWAVQHNCYICFEGSGVMEPGTPPIPTQVTFNPGYDFNRPGMIGIQNSPVPCPYTGCAGENDLFDAQCGTCERILACTDCGIGMFTNNKKWHCADHTMLPEVPDDETRLFCAGCRPLCQMTVTRQQRAEGFPAPRESGYCANLCIGPTWKRCLQHAGDDVWTCTGCTRLVDAYYEVATELGEDVLCKKCVRDRCRRCGDSVGHANLIKHSNMMMCQACYERAMRVQLEVCEPDVGMPARAILMESLPERPIRMMSIEQEFEGAPTDYDGRCATVLGDQLHKAGLSPFNQRMRYHTGEHDGFCHVERDSSVESGGELIYHRIRLDQPAEAESMEKTMDIVRAAHAAGKIRFTAKCGAHIHIDMHGYNIADARNLVTIYSYLEDVIYRLAGSGYGDHRAAMTGSNYALPIRKEKWDTIAKFGAQFLRNADHTDSLNLQHYYKALKGCHCGAVEFGEFQNCRCQRPKCTAEWRVFNGTGHPVRLRSWAVFAQAVTAWCQNRELDYDAYEPLPFEQSIDFSQDELNDAHGNLVEAWVPRIAWIFAHLPLTRADKEGLIWTMKTSPLKHIGDEEMDRMMAVPQVRDEGRVLEPSFALSRGEFDDTPRMADGLTTAAEEIRSRLRWDVTPADDYPDTDDEGDEF